MITIDKERCPQNHKCPLIKLCPVEAISQEGVLLPKIDHDLCIECGKCVQYCGMRAIKTID